MKKVLLSLLAVAALVLSCQNYDDEFAALNTKIASLESQITSLAELRTAVTGVQSSISSLQSAVAAAQAAAEAADNADAISALATSVAAIAADLVDLQTAIDGATTEADLTALKEELNTTLAALQALIESNSASIANLVTSNTELKDALEQLGVDVDSVLAANATFEGNLTITNDAELAYAKSLGIKVATIKGDVYVKVDAFKHTSGGDGTGLTASEVNDIVSKITYVVGNVKIDSDESLDLSSLASVTGDYIVKGHDISDDALLSVGGDIHFDYDGPYSSKIQTAGNIFLVVYDDADAATDGSEVAKVGTTSIDFLALTKATGVQTVSANEASSHTSGASLTYGATEADQKIAVSPVTTSVKIGQAPVVSVTSAGTTAATTALTTIELHYAADKGDADDGLSPTGVNPLASLTISGGELSSVTVKAKQITGNVSITTQFATATTNSATVDLSSVLTIGGKLTSGASTNTLTALESVSGIELTEQTSVSLPALTKSTSALATGGASLSKNGSITLTEATSFSAPLLATVGATSTANSGEQLRADITANKLEGAVSLPKLTLAGNLSFTNASSFSAPDAVITKITLNSTATSVEVASVRNPESDIVDMATLTTIKLNAQRAYLAVSNSTPAVAQRTTYNTTVAIDSDEFDLAAKLTSLTLKGYVPSNTAAVIDLTIDYGSGTYALNKLASLTVANLDALVIDATDTGIEANGTATAPAVPQSSLSTVVTSGTMRSVSITDAYNLTSLTLGHTEDLYSTEPNTLVINNNRRLNSFSTTQSMVHVLKITRNLSLSSFDLTSLVKVPVNVVDVAANNANLSEGAVNTLTMHIFGNHISPLEFDQVSTATVTDATAAVAALVVTNWDGIYGTYTASSGAQERAYTQGSLATLAGFIDAIDARFPKSSTAAATDYPHLDVKLGYKYQKTAVANGDSANSVGDIQIAQAAFDISSDGIAAEANVSPTIISAGDELLLMAELQKIQ